MRTVAQIRAAVAPLLVVGFAIAAGGCTSDPPPHEPDPRPRYQPAQTGLCEQIRVADVGTRFHLAVRPGSASPGLYGTARTFWYATCGSFRWLADDTRLATNLGPFSPGGVVSVEVHHDVAGAQEDYRRGLNNYVNVHGVRAGAGTGALPGWWDDGVYLVNIRRIDPDDVVVDDVNAARVEVSHLVRHHNLTLETNLNALSPSADTGQVIAFLHDLADALIDETADHL